MVRSRGGLAGFIPVIIMGFSCRRNYYFVNFDRLSKRHVHFPFFNSSPQPLEGIGGPEPNFRAEGLLTGSMVYFSGKSVFGLLFLNTGKHQK
jgi:hypothetical protein